MTGSEHTAEAERLIGAYDQSLADFVEEPEDEHLQTKAIVLSQLIGLAQLHAMLAQADYLRKINLKLSTP